MPVSIGAVTLDDVLDWEEEEDVTVPIKRVVRKPTPTVQAEYFTRSPRIIVLTLRATGTLRNSIRSLKNQFAWQQLNDYDNSFVDYVFIRNIRPEWQGDRDYNYPWLLRLTLVCSSV